MFKSLSQVISRRRLKFRQRPRCSAQKSLVTLQSPQKALHIPVPPLCSDHLSKPIPLLLPCCSHTGYLFVLRAHQACSSSKPKDTQQAPLTTFFGFCSTVIFSFTGTSLTTVFKSTSPLSPQILSHSSLNFPPNVFSTICYLCFTDFFCLFVYCLLPTKI